MKQPHQEDRQKITAFLPTRELDFAMTHSGKGITETLQEALRRYNHDLACQELLKLKGKIKFDMTWQELRDKDGDRDLTQFLKRKPKRK